MTNQLQIFSNEEFGKIRTLGTADNPLFCLADVCRALELDASQVMKRLEDGVVTIHPITDKLGRQQNANFVNEDGLYDVILDSRKPEAKKFRKWITSEVIPSIRKTGSYSMYEKKAVTVEDIKALIANPQLLIELCQALINERAEKQELRNIVDMQAIEIAELTPKANYYDLILQSKEALPVSVIAKDYGYSAKSMNKILKDMEIQYRLGNGVWLVYQNYAKEGYTCTKTFVLEDGTTKTHTYWTQKGRIFLYEMLKRRGIIPLIEQVDTDD